MRTGNKLLLVILFSVLTLFSSLARADSVPPASISGLSLDADSPTENGEIYASWTNPSDVDLAGVEFRYRIDGVFPTSATDGTRLALFAGEIPGGATSTIFQGLNEEKFYMIAGFAYDDSDPANYSDAATDAAYSSGLKPKDLNPPHPVSSVFRALPYVPDGVELTMEDGDIYLAWIFPDDLDTAGVVFRARTDGTFPTSVTDGFEFTSGVEDIYPGYNYATATIATGLTLGQFYYITAFTYDDETLPNFDPIGMNAEAGEAAAPQNKMPPDEVSNFTIDNVSPESNGELYAVWTNPSDTDFVGVIFRYRTDGVFPVDEEDGTYLGNVLGAPGEVSGTSWSGLDENTTYSISAFTYDNAEPPNVSSGSASAEGSVRPKDLIPPGSISGLALSNAVPSGDGELYATWSNPSDIDLAGVRFRYRTDGAVPQTATDPSSFQLEDVAMTAGEAGSATFTGLTPGQMYVIAGFAYDDEAAPNYGVGATNSFASRKAKETTPPGPVVFNTVDNTMPSQNGQIFAEWTEPADADYSGVLFVYRTDGAYPADASDGVELSAASPGTTSVTWSGLDENTTYHIGAFGYDDQDAPNFGAADALAQAALKPKDLIAPNKLITFDAYNTAASSTGEIYASWVFPSAVDFAGVEFRYRTDGQFPADETDGMLLSQETGAPGSAGSTTWSGLSEETLYRIAAFSYDDEATPNYSSGATKGPMAPKDSTPPDLLAELVLDNESPTDSGTLIAYWTNPSNGDFAGVRFRYRTDGQFPSDETDGNWLKDRTGTPGAAASTPFTGLDAETTYYIAAFSYDSQDTPNFSGAANAAAGGIKPKDLDPPSAPTGFDYDNESPAGDGQIILSWTNPSDADFAGVTVLYRTDGAFPASPTDGVAVLSSAETGSEATQTLLTGLDSSEYYSFSIFAYDDEVEPNYSAGAELSGAIKAKDLTAPGPIEGFALDNLTPTANGEFLATWTNPSDADLSAVRFRYNQGSVFPADANDGTLLEEVAAVPGAAGSHTFSGFDEETLYAIAAFTVDDEAAPNVDAVGATPTSALKPRDLTPPDPPIGLIVSKGGATHTGELGLSWTGPSTPDFAGVLVKYVTNGQPLSSPQDGATLTVKAGLPDAPGFVIATGLDENAEHLFAVFAYDDEAHPNYSAAEVAANPVKPLDLAAPAIPGDYALSNDHPSLDSGEILATWTNPADIDLQGAQFRYRTDGTFPTSITDGNYLTDVEPAPGEIQAVYLIHLATPTTYWISMFLYDDEASPNVTAPIVYGSGLLPADPLEGGVPGPIEDFVLDNSSASLAHGELKLSWTNPADVDYAGVIFRYRTDGEFPQNPNDGIQISLEMGSPGKSQEVTLVGLNDQKTYYISAFTYDDSNPPNIRKTPTEAPQGYSPKDLEPPSAPAQFQASGSDGSVLLTWRNPDETDFDEVKIRRRQGSIYPATPDDPDSAQLYTGDAEQFSDKSVQNGVKYSYAIFASDKSGNWSDRAIVTAVPGATRLDLRQGWNLVGVSNAPSPADIEQIFAGYDVKLFLIENGRYLSAPELITSFFSGRAYWVWSGEDYDEFRPPGKSLSSEFYTMSYKGWHGFSNPFDVGFNPQTSLEFYCDPYIYTLEQAVPDITSGVIYKYDPGADKYVEEAGLLAPWTGYFIQTSEECVLKLIKP